MDRKLRVTYHDKTYSGEKRVETEIFKTWNEEGSYTLFYDDVSLDSIKLIIPTKNVIRIDFINTYK